MEFSRANGESPLPLLWLYRSHDRPDRNSSYKRHGLGGQGVSRSLFFLHLVHDEEA